MRTSIALAGLCLLFATSAHALPADAKKLAQFDIGYARCEKLYPEMRGHRDQAYLALWRVNADAKARSRLSALRKGSSYKQERQLALKTMDMGKGPEAEAKLKLQCEGTWAEAQRNAPATPPAK